MIKRETILKNVGIKQLTPMQNELLDAHKENKNLMLLSPTGSGKTIAFLIASFEKLRSEEAGSEQVVIIAPTRELVQQIGTVAKNSKTGVNVVMAYGGRKLSLEEDMLSAKAEVIVATPGRLADHLRRENIDGSKIHHLVIDEYDKCVEMGFTEELIEIFSAMQNIETRIISSATSQSELPKYLGFRDGKVIDYSSQSEPLEEGKIATKMIQIKDDNLETLLDLLTNIDDKPTLIFCNYRESCERVYDFLRDEGVTCDFYHGAQEQYIRERALLKLRMGAINILIATDIAARGLDISMLSYVIHYEMPQSIESFVHRSGRTGRMNSSGGDNFVLSREFGLLPDYISQYCKVVDIRRKPRRFERAKYSMVYIGAGRKQKISKGDIVGFLTTKCLVESSDIGMIQIWDNESYVAINSKIVDRVVKSAKGERIKKSRPVFRFIP